MYCLAVLLAVIVLRTLLNPVLHSPCKLFYPSGSRKMSIWDVCMYMSIWITCRFLDADLSKVKNLLLES